MAKRSFAPVASLLLIFGSICLLPAEWRLSLEQASSRTTPSYAPAFQDQIVFTEGVVATNPVQVAEYLHTPLQDSQGHGLMLETQPGQFPELKPGNVLQVQGLIQNRDGQPVLVPNEVHLLRHMTPPAPQALRPDDLHDVNHMARYVVVEGRITRTGETADGDFVQIGTDVNSVRVVLPKTVRGTTEGLDRYGLGDRVRVTGITSQNCPKPPFNRFFEVLVEDPKAVTLTERDWLIAPGYLLVGVLLLTLSLIGWWVRENRQGRLRKSLRSLNSLGEDLLAAQTPVEIVERLRSSLISIAHASSVQMYLYHPETKSLDRVRTSPDDESTSISVEAPVGPTGDAVVLAFRNRTLLHVTDTKMSPLWRSWQHGKSSPKSAVFIPMLAKNEVIGVLEIDRLIRVRSFSEDEQSATQHLGNQIAVALRLQEQHLVREQLFRSEKLAASGHLISGVADQLRGPLETITSATSDALSYRLEPVVVEMLQDAMYAARRASEIVSRLVSFTRNDASEVRRFDLHRVVSGIVQFRQQEWRLRNIDVVTELTSDRVSVMAAQGQLEQVLLNLLIYAEQSVEHTANRTITITTLTIAKQVIIEIIFGYDGIEQPAPNPLQRSADSDPLDLGVCRTLMQGQSGDLRFVQTRPDLCRFEVELPLTTNTRPERGPGGSARPMTVLVVEPDPAAQRELLTLIGSRGHRVVPVASAEEAGELAERLRFDLAFSAVRLPGSSWVELFDHIRDQVGAFVLVTEGYDADLSRVVQAGDGYLLTRPIEDGELDALLESAGQKVTMRLLSKPLG